MTLLSPSKRNKLIRAARAAGQTIRDRRARAHERAAALDPVVIDGAELAKTVGLALRAARLARGLTQRDVARMTGSYGPVVARTERGAHTPNLSVIVKHMIAVGFSLSDLGTLIDASVS